MSDYESKQVQLPGGETITLRPPEVDEAPALLEYLDAMRCESDGVMFDARDEMPTLEKERDFIRERREDGSALMLGAFDVVGSLIALGSIRKESAMAHKARVRGLGISVRRAWWRRGVGDALLGELMGFARNHPDIDLVQLTAFSFNPGAIRLYERHGFEHEGVQRWAAHFEDGSYADSVAMSCWVGTADPPTPREHDPVVRAWQAQEKIKA